MNVYSLSNATETWVGSTSVGRKCYSNLLH
jgi:hypothetical protein